MISIIKYDNYCQILNESDRDRIKSLDLALSFKVIGAEHSKAYKGYINSRGEEVTWDGRKHLLKGNLQFPIGLIERVINFYKSNNVEFTVIDERKNVSENTPINISHNLQKLNIEPREYQINAVNEAIKHNRGIIRAATGAGKTLIIALLTAYFGKKTIIYVIGKDLLYQFHKFFSNVFDEEIGIIGDGKCEIKRINICTVWSVSKALDFSSQILDDELSQDEKEIEKDKVRDIKTMLLENQVSIMDECHLAAADVVQNISAFIKPEYFYGLSASPWRDDGQDMLIEAVLGRKIVDISAKYLIEQGFLTPPIIRFLPVPQYQGPKSAKYQTVYKKYIVDNDERNEMILKAAISLVNQGFKVLILFKSKAHGKKLFKLISKHINCCILDGDDKFSIRKNACDDLYAGKIDCILASTIFDIGVDLPILSALIAAGGGKSSVRAFQRIGRVIRKYKNKKIAAVIDFCDRAPHLYGHSLRRKEILEQEFEVQWPKKKQ